MKLSEMSEEELKEKLEMRSRKLKNECKWVHKDRRYMSLLNERQRRIMKNWEVKENE